jgi:hypothetical protein
MGRAGPRGLHVVTIDRLNPGFSERRTIRAYVFSGPTG